MVSVILITLVLGVVQLALAQHVRNTLQDAASEGARAASLADSSLVEGEQKTAELISVALGPAYATSIQAATVLWQGRVAVAVSIDAPLPLLWLFGPAHSLHVVGHSTKEVVQ